VFRLLTLLTVFVAGYLWGDQALSFVMEAWQEASEASRFKFEELFE